MTATANERPKAPAYLESLDYKPCPMLSGGDGAVGWITSDGRAVEVDERFPTAAGAMMPADAIAAPGIVADGRLIALRATGKARDALPPSPVTWDAGATRTALYRALDVRLSAEFDFGLVRSFGWRMTDGAALFVLEADTAIALPAGLDLPPLADLPVLDGDAITDALEVIGAFDGDAWPVRVSEPLDPVAAWKAARDDQSEGRQVAGIACGNVLIPAGCPDDPHGRERAGYEAEWQALAEARRAKEAEIAAQGGVRFSSREFPVMVETASTAPPVDPYAGLYDVPGLVGDITRWIVATSHRPLPLHALGAALVAVGTAAGRKYKGPTFSGTHLYIAALAVTGAGKDHPGAALLSILEAAGMGEHTGASSFKSASSIVALIARSPLTAMKIDEFGAFLKKMNDVKGGSHLTEMSGELRSLWGASFKVYKTPEWAGMASKTIHAPAVSIFGTTTPTDFYEGLRGADATNGFLNRFAVFEVAGRPAMQEPTADPSEVPAHIAEAMSMIYSGGGDFGAFSRNDPGKPQTIINVPWGEGAKALYDEALRHAERIADQNPTRGDYYSRSAEMALRMATIVGIGCDPVAPIVTAEAMRWAIRVVAIATKALFDNADALIADNVAQANYKMVKGIIRKAKGEIGRSALTKAIDGRLPPRVLDDILGALIEAGDVEVVAGERGKNGKVPLSYRITAQGA